MSFKLQPILGVPTNIITGFLGVGKTTAILNLLKNKPEGERWAVLVNEFGEIGVDGSLFQGQQSKTQDVFIREVPGGCMCCTAGLPMQVALNKLLSEAKPDRLLIEPTGLGHPKEVLQVLSSEQYRKVLSLQLNITLVDARKLADTRYTQNETFNQQIEVANTIVGNKLDLYQDGDKESLEAYVSTIASPNTKVIFTQDGVIDFAELFSELKGEGNIETQPLHHHYHHHHKSRTLASELPMPASGIIKAINKQGDIESIGWRFSADKRFDHQRLLNFFKALKVERMKAVVITQDGIFAYNLTDDGLTESALTECIESRIEIIAKSIDSILEEQLLQCLFTVKT